MSENEKAEIMKFLATVDPADLTPKLVLNAKHAFPENITNAEKILIIKILSTVALKDLESRTANLNKGLRTLRDASAKKNFLEAEWKKMSPEAQELSAMRNAPLLSRKDALESLELPSVSAIYVESALSEASEEFVNFFVL